MGGVLRRVAILLGAAAALATASNAVRPRGLSWTRPLGPELRARAVEAGLVPVDLAAVRLLLKDGRTVFIDSRPRDEFEIGELPGAISMSWKDVEEGRPPAPPPADRPVVVYCANAWCESSLLLGRWLKGRGVRDVALFVDGYEVWWNEDGAPR